MPSNKWTSYGFFVVGFEMKIFFCRPWLLRIERSSRVRIRAWVQICTDYTVKLSGKIRAKCAPRFYHGKYSLFFLNWNLPHQRSKNLENLKIWTSKNSMVLIFVHRNHNFCPTVKKRPKRRWKRAFDSEYGIFMFVIVIFWGYTFFPKNWSPGICS